MTRSLSRRLVAGLTLIGLAGLGALAGCGDSGTGTATAGQSGQTPAAASTMPITGGTGARYDYNFQGAFEQRYTVSCPVLAPAEVDTLRVPDVGKMWLSGGVLHATGTLTPHNEYTGQLRQDGSFHLESSVSPPSVLDGRIAADGTMTGTWDLPWDYEGCPTHMQLTGHAPTVATVAGR